MRLIDYKYYKREEKILFWFTLFIVIQFIQIVFNISFYFFPFFIYFYFVEKGKPVKLFSTFSLLAIAFAIGALLSYAHSSDQDSSGLVILNYMYWSLILILFNSIKNTISLRAIFDAILLGLIICVLYYHIFQHIGFQLIPIFKDYSQNAFSFLAICFTPIATYHFISKNGKQKGLFFGISLIVLSFLSGSRAGSLLVAGGVVSALLIDQLRFRTILFYTIIIALFGNFFIALPFVQDTIYNLNERTYDIIYNTEEVFSSDRSYLIRRSMVEKGLEIFNENKKYGIGLNNFQGYEIQLPGEFEGAQYVINKGKIMDIGSHNSYINILAEGGLFLFVPFVSILAIIILTGLFTFHNVSDFQRIILVSIILMCIHLYVITAILNVMAWFIIALGFVGMNWGKRRSFQ